METVIGEARSGPPEASDKSCVINGVRTELIEKGEGPSLLFLHPGIGIEGSTRFLEALAAKTRVIAPSHPGFGGSDQPPSFSSIDDLAYFYLDLLDALDLDAVTLVGVSLGGFIAAEIAVKCTRRLSRLVLGNPVGIKVGGRETRDIVDIFALTEHEFAEHAYFEAALGRRDYKSMSEQDVRRIARNREATARYGWSPYLHDPKLKDRLHRIRIPTLFLWGVADRILSEAYGRAYCAALPGARFETIERAGHFPHIEQPDAFARRVLAFMEAR